MEITIYQVITWVFSGVGLVMFKFLPYPLLSITREEVAFLNYNLRILRRLSIEFIIMLLFIFYAIVLTNINLQSHSISSIFPYITDPLLSKKIINILEFITLIIWILLITVRYSKKLQKNVYSRLKKTPRAKKLTLFEWSFYIIVVSFFVSATFHFGYTLNLILTLTNENFELHQSYSMNVLLVLTSLPVKTHLGIYIIFLILFLCYRIIINVLLSINIQIHQIQVVSTITLTNGKIFDNKYILRPSVDGNILIGNNPRIEKCTEKTLLPKQNIMFIDFKRCSFGEETITDINKDTAENGLPSRKSRNKPTPKGESSNVQT